MGPLDDDAIVTTAISLLFGVVVVVGAVVQFSSFTTLLKLLEVLLRKTSNSTAHILLGGFVHTRFKNIVRSSKDPEDDWERYDLWLLMFLLRFLLLLGYHSSGGAADDLLEYSGRCDLFA